MGRQKKPKVVPIDTDSVTPATVTADTYPEGTPTIEDGTVASSASMSLTQARKVGAITPDAAARNKRTAKTVARKQNGETHVKWNEDNAIHMFDPIVQAFSSQSLFAYISQISPETIEYPPVRCNAFSNSAMFYDHLLKNIHKCRGTATYEVQFKDATAKQWRGTGKVTLPSTLEDPNFNNPNGGNNMNHNNGYPPPYGYQQPQPYGYPPPGYPVPPGYQAPQPYTAPPGQGYNPYAPPQPAAAPVAASPAPAPAPAPVQAAPQPQPQPQYQQPPQQQPTIVQPGTDPALAAAIHQMMGEIRTLQQQTQYAQMQSATSLGALEEFKRLQATREMYPQPIPPPVQMTPQQPMQQQAPPPPPPPQQGLGAPPSPWGAPQPPPQYQPQPPPYAQTLQGPQPLYDAYGRHAGWTQQPSAQPVAAAPSLPQQGAPPPPPPPTGRLGGPPAPSFQQSPMDPFAQMAGFASMLKGVMGSVESIKHTLGVEAGGGRGAAAEEDEPVEGIIPVPPPETARVTTRLGFADNSPVLITKKDGAVDGLGTVLANIGHLPDLMHRAAEGIAAINTQTNRIQHARPIMAQGHPVQHQQQPPQQQPVTVQAQPGYAPPPPPLQQAPQQPSFVPSVDSLR